MASPQNREEALFQAAVELTGAERVGFLNGACLGDHILRLRLEALLAAHEQLKLALGDKPGHDRGGADDAWVKAYQAETRQREAKAVFKAKGIPLPEPDSK